jgi:DNA replication and repair protein RecF
LVVGRNASGKTNLVEAITVLSQGRSHRTSTDTEMVGWGAGFARVEGVLGTPAGETLEVVLAAPGTTAGGARKRVRVNGVPRRATALAQSLPSVLFAPEDMLLVVGSPGLRRGLLDELIVQRSVTAGASLTTYARALAQRNSLLRRIREEEASRDELPYWDDLIVREGGRIVSWRLEAMDALSGPLAAAHREIADEEGTLSLRYITNAPTQGEETPTDALRRRLDETVEKELWNGATLVGPHRDDVMFELDGRDLSTFASRGQQRTAILALKLAQVELVANAAGRQPLLLLDDVFSELDPIRRSHLVRRIAQLPQAFITTTTPDDLDPALVAVSTAWRVESGTLRREA